MADLPTNPSSNIQVHSFINSLLNKILNPEDFLVGLKYTLLKDNAFKKINENINKDINEKHSKISKDLASSIAEASFDAFSPKNTGKNIRAKSSKIISLCDKLFSYNVYGEELHVESGLYEYLDNIANIDEMSFKKDNFSKSSSKLSSNTSTTSLRGDLQTVQSKKHFKTLKSSVSNYKLFNYDDDIQSIITIQKFWKGYKARSYFKAYILLKSKATKIQSL